MLNGRSKARTRPGLYRLELLWSQCSFSGVEQLVITIALVGIVVIVASLLSGALDRSGLPIVAVFILLGALLGPPGLNVVDIEFQSPALQVLATLGLALVLFSDAVALDIRAVREARSWEAFLTSPLVGS